MGVWNSSFVTFELKWSFSVWQLPKMWSSMIYLSDNGNSRSHHKRDYELTSVDCEQLNNTFYLLWY